MNATLNITRPVNVTIIVAPPAPASKVATAIETREVVAMVSRAVNAAYYNGTL